MTDILDLDDLDSEERDALLKTRVELDPHSQAFIDALVERLLLFADELSGHPLYGYQRPFAARLMESVIINDGATITALFSRQSGKTETVAVTVATLMIMLPRLAKLPTLVDLLGDFKEGVRSEEHTSELQSHVNLVCRLLLEKKKKKY